MALLGYAFSYKQGQDGTVRFISGVSRDQVSPKGKDFAQEAIYTGDTTPIAWDVDSLRGQALHEAEFFNAEDFHPSSAITDASTRRTAYGLAMAIGLSSMRVDERDLMVVCRDLGVGIQDLTTAQDEMRSMGEDQPAETRANQTADRPRQARLSMD